ncbi:MAG TPA: hypothetical protein VGB96_09155 [Archangium sp.]
MALLQLNGVPVECEASDWEAVTLGEVTRSFNGWPRDTGRVRKKDFRFTSGLLSVSDAEAVRGLVEGAGHLLSFEDAAGYLYTSRELAPLSTTGASRTTTGARHGAACLSLASGATLSWAVGVEGYEDGLGTLMAWVREGAGAWKHVVATARSGAVYQNGVRTAPSGGYAYGQVQGGVLQLGNLGGPALATAWDDVVALPYTVPPAWVPHLYAWHAARPWAPLPYVVASGPRFPTAGLQVKGRAGAARAAALLTTVGESFDFTLYGT